MGSTKFSDTRKRKLSSIMAAVTDTPGQPPHSQDECPLPSVSKKAVRRRQWVVFRNCGTDLASLFASVVVSREGGSTSPLGHLMVRGPLESHDSSPNPGGTGKTGHAAGHRGSVINQNASAGLAAVEAVPKVHGGPRLRGTAIVHGNDGEITTNEKRDEN